jgi:hypothetical protein
MCCNPQIKNQIDNQQQQQQQQQQRGEKKGRRSTSNFTLYSHQQKRVSSSYCVQIQIHTSNGDKTKKK